MWQRLWSLARKEFIQIRRDKRTLGMMIVLPLLWLMIFGYAFSFDVSGVTVAVIDQSGTEVGATLAGAIRGYEKFTPVTPADPTEAGVRAMMHRDELGMAVFIPPGFGDLDVDPAPQMQVLVDGSELFTAQAAARLLQPAMEPVQDEIQDLIEAQVRADMQARIEAEMAARTAAARARADEIMADKKAEVQAEMEAQLAEQVAERQQQAEAMLAQAPPLVRQMLEPKLAEMMAAPELPDLEFSVPDDLIETPDFDSLDIAPPQTPKLIPQMEILYNPDLKSANVMIPGLLGMVTMFMSTVMTALGVVREREHGTLEQLVVTPIRPAELMVGKVLPYAVVAAGDFLLVLVVGSWLFDLEFAGNLPLFLALTLLFLLATLGMGLLISTVAQNQQQAMQLALFSVMPQMVLSGLIFPLSSMPQIIQYVAYLFPFTYFVPIARGMFIKGQGLDLLWLPALVVGLYSVAMLAIASVQFRKRLG